MGLGDYLKARFYASTLYRFVNGDGLEAEDVQGAVNMFSLLNAL